MIRHTVVPYLILLSGVLVASTAAIMIRLSQQAGMPSLTIAAGRLALATLILTPIVWTRAVHELRLARRRDVLLSIGSGLFLALHFAAWISSLEYTSVANSTALVTTNPIWVGLISWVVLRERPGWRLMLGVALSIMGSLFLVVSGLSEAATLHYRNPTLGNVLALLGAVAVSGYLLIGRTLRQRLSVTAYIWIVYTTAAVVLLVCMFLSGQQFSGFSPLAYLLVLALALGPQLLGHTAFNWALGYLSATFVAVSILAEPIGSAVIAWFLLQERIDFAQREGALQLAGFVLLLIGIYAAATSERRVMKLVPSEPDTLTEAIHPSVAPATGEAGNANHR